MLRISFTLLLMKKAVNSVLDRLDSDELIQLIESIQLELTEEKLTEVIIRLNRTGRLDELLELLSMTDIISPEQDYQSGLLKTAKIVVFGESKLKANVLTAVGEKLGISKDRFEFHLDYHDAKTFDFSKFQYNPNYSLILVGPMGHSGRSKEGDSSVISHIAHEEGYPPVVKLIAGSQLKITKTNFRDTLKKQLDNGRIMADIPVT